MAYKTVKTTMKRGTKVPPPPLLPHLDTGEDLGKDRGAEGDLHMEEGASSWKRGPPKGQLNAEWLHKEEGHQEYIGGPPTAGQFLFGTRSAYMALPLKLCNFTCFLFILGTYKYSFITKIATFSDIITTN